MILRKLLGNIRFMPDEDGGLWAEYEIEPAALLKRVGTDGSGGPIAPLCASAAPRPGGADIASSSDLRSVRFQQLPQYRSVTTRLIFAVTADGETGLMRKRR